MSARIDHEALSGLKGQRLLESAMSCPASALLSSWISAMCVLSAISGLNTDAV